MEKRLFKQFMCMVLSILLLTSILPTYAFSEVTIDDFNFTLPVIDGDAILTVTGTVNSVVSEDITLTITKKNDPSFTIGKGTESVISGGKNTYKFEVALTDAVDAEYLITIGGKNVKTQVTKTFIYDSTAVMKSFKLGNVAGVIKGKDITVTFPAGKNITDLTAEYVTSANAVVKVNGNVIKSGANRFNYSSPVDFTVICGVNANETNTYTVTAKVLTEPKGSGQGGTNYTGGKTQTGVVIPERENPFKDIADVKWAEEYIYDLADKNIMVGKGDGTFEPNRNITREEFAKVLISAFGLTADNAKCDFTDVAVSDWFYKDVAIASSLGIIKGMGDGTFGTNRPITRQDMAVMVYRAINIKGITLGEVNSNPTFSDSSSIAEYAKLSVESMSKAGIINGKGNSLFAPLDSATRAETAKIISTLINL